MNGIQNSDFLIRFKIYKFSQVQIKKILTFSFALNNRSTMIILKLYSEMDEVIKRIQV